MKKLFMKEKLLSNLNEFTIKNEEEADVYYVHSDFVQIGSKKLHIEDMSGKELAMVQQKILALMPKFFIYKDGQQIAEIQKKMALFKAKYIVTNLNWEVTGNFLDHDYTITDGNKEIVRMHKAWLSWGDSYEIDIAEGTDEVMTLAVVLAIDSVMQAQQDASDHES